MIGPAIIESIVVGNAGAAVTLLHRFICFRRPDLKVHLISPFGILSAEITQLHPIPSSWGEQIMLAAAPPKSMDVLRIYRVLIAASVPGNGT